MSITLTMPELTELQPKITVIGVGGAGGNAVNNMIKAQLLGVNFIVANTDAQALAHSSAEQKVQLGVALTQGLGAGARPEVGRAAAEESIAQIEEYLAGSHMVFVTAGMGGGTGTGAAPVVAKLARERGILTVGVITKPFQFEGSRRMRLAEQGIEELQKYVDTLIIIPNQNLFRIANEKTTFADAFTMADEVLHSGVRGITDLMVMPGLVNLDFADVRTVMSEMGKAMMGTGEAEGENRALEAAEAAISNPLLDEISMKGARGVLINITGGMDLTLFEVDEAANRIRSEVDPEANILVGSALNESLNGRMRVSVVATGIETESAAGHNNASVPSSVYFMNRKAADLAPVTAEEETATSEEILESELELVLMEEADTAMVAEAEQASIPEEAFIAPEPVLPPVRAQDQMARSDSFADTATTNGAGRKEKSGLSWFDRMRGVTKRDEKRPENVQPEFSAIKEPVRKPAPAKPASAAPKAPVSDVQSAQDQSVEGRRKLDEQLEIPTFLRRQAN
jgi:cell division protein FtsZ